MESNEYRMDRPLRGVVTLVEHRSPGIEQTQRNGWVGNLVAQIIGNAAVGVDTLEVRPDLAR
jgi:hypothetical protein